MSALVMFGNNLYKITNNEGKQLTLAYIRRYIHCTCRIADGFDHPNRKQIIEDYMSVEFLKTMVGRTAAAVATECLLDPRWDEDGHRPIRNNVQKAEMKRRADGIKTVNPKTVDGKKMLAEAAKRNEEANAAAAKKARYDAIKAQDPNTLKRLLKMDTSMFPADVAAPIEQLKRDYADMVAEEKATK